MGLNRRGRFAALVAKATKDLNADLEEYPELNNAMGLECLMTAYLNGYTGTRACKEAVKHLEEEVAFMLKIMKG